MNTKILSPHLSIYSTQITSSFSILHRFSGILLSLLFILYFLINNVNLLETYNYIYFYVYNYIFFKYFFVFIKIIALFFLNLHFFTGIRHLIWDFTYGLNLKFIYSSANLLINLTFLLTFLILFISIE